MVVGGVCMAVRILLECIVVRGCVVTRDYNTSLLEMNINCENQLIALETHPYLQETIL